MAFHHVALATKDLTATHRFYTEVMGFTLAKMVVGGTPEGGWAKHVFFETGAADDGMIAFWEIHDDKLGDYPTDLNRGIGLPTWVNHLAFDAPSASDFDARRVRWQEHGYAVLELDHGFCRSIYIEDPNGITVEFCCTTRPFSADERQWAADNLTAESPEWEEAPSAILHEPLLRVGGAE
jgi:catechol 2,3-dioxygenase-like lactoylglutathione lyase family enzyme